LPPATKPSDSSVVHFLLALSAAPVAIVDGVSSDSSLAIARPHHHSFWECCELLMVHHKLRC
jgi:hypothetical protein